MNKILGLIAVLSLFGGLMILSLYPTSSPKISGDFIPFDHLATEQTDPYLVAGRPPVGKKANKAAKRYASVRECLIASEQQNEMPDLRQFAWQNMRSYDVASVCLFRVFSSLGTPERTTLWLESQGLEAFRGTSLGKPNNRWGTVSVSAVNLLKESGFLLVGWGAVHRKFAIQFGSWGDDRESVNSRWSEDGTLLSVSVSYNSL